MRRGGDAAAGLVAGDHGGEQGRAGGAAGGSERPGRRHHHGAGVDRAGAVAVVELQPVAGGAGEIGGSQQVVARGEAGHRHRAGAVDAAEDALGDAGDLLAGAGDDGAQRVDQMAARGMAGEVVHRFEPQRREEAGQLGRGAGDGKLRMCADLVHVSLLSACR